MSQSKNLHDIVALKKIRVSEDLVLIELDKTHAREILTILTADPSIKDRVSVASKLHSYEDVLKEIENIEQDEGLIRYVIVCDEKVLGLVSFWRDDGFSGKINPDDYGFGYFLHPNERGKGTMTIAVEKLMKVAVNELYIDQFILYCEDDNKASIAVLERLGFEPTNLVITEPTMGWVERKYEKRVR